MGEHTHPQASTYVVAPSVVQSQAWLLPLGRCRGPVSLESLYFPDPGMAAALKPTRPQGLLTGKPTSGAQDPPGPVLVAKGIMLVTIAQPPSWLPRVTLNPFIPPWSRPLSPQPVQAAGT